MSATRKPPPPDMGGLTDDWKRLQDLRGSAKDSAQGEQSDGDATTPGAPDASNDDQEDEPAARPAPKPGRSRGGKRPPPAAADAVPTTIRFDPEEARDITRFVLDLADDAGRRNLDKAEVFRELIRQAQEHQPTRKALVRRLR